MIIKGKSRGGAASLAKHLNNAEKNERVTLGGLRGVLSDTLEGALQEMQDIASGTRCKNGMYHAQVSPDPTETMTPEKWARSIEALEENLGLNANHPRAIVFHEKNGREHAHIVWGRIDPENMRAWHDGHNYQKHEETSRQLEQEFNHARVKGAFTREGEEARPERTPKHWEMQQGERLNIDPLKVREEIKTIFEQADNGRSFAAALDGAGYTLAQGRGNSFAVLDHEGGIHTLSRTLGLKVAEIGQRLDGINREALPTVEAVREQLAETRAAAPEIEATRTRRTRHKEQQEPAPSVTATDWADALKAMGEFPKAPPTLEQYQERAATYRPSAERDYSALHETHKHVAETLSAKRENIPDIGETASRVTGKVGGAALSGMSAAAGAVGKIAEGLENFFFGSTKGHHQEPNEGAKDMTSPQEGRFAYRYTKGQEKTPDSMNSAAVKTLVASHPMQIDPEMLAAVRRAREERERADRERNRER